MMTIQGKMAFSSIFLHILVLSFHWNTTLSNPTPDPWPRVPFPESQPDIFSLDTTKIRKASTTTLLTQQEADEICASPAFALTVDNWWLSGATEWLKEYALTNSKTARYEKYGLIGSIASEYLKKTNFKCSIDTPHRCGVECVDVVSRVGNTADARVVFFTLASAQHVSEVMKIVHDALLAAQINMAELVPQMTRTFFWIQGSDQRLWAMVIDHVIQTLTNLFGMFFPMLELGRTINTELRKLFNILNLNYEKAEQAALEARVEYMNYQQGQRIDVDLSYYAKKYEDAEETKNRAEKAKNIMKGTMEAMEQGFTGIAVGQLSSNILRGFTMINDKISHPGDGTEKSFAQNSMNLDSFIRLSTMRARESLKETAESLFAGGMVLDDGSTFFSDFTRNGNFLPDDQDNAANWRRADVEKKITRSVLLKTLNAAFISQRIYITCTEDFRRTSKPWEPSVEKLSDKPLAASCRKDNTGPSDMKACVDNYVCYLYKWNDRGGAIGWRNEKIFGIDKLDEEPWGVEIQDVITSSVRGYTENKRGLSPSNQLSNGVINGLENSKSALAMWDASAPGMFTIPTCFSTHNWATVLDGYRFPKNGIFDTTPRNSIKNLPCNCGPMGRDTETVWKEIGIWGGEKDRFFKNYASDRCGYQIYDKITEPLERYVAYCRLHVHTVMNGRIRYMGKDFLCDAIIGVLEKRGYPALKELNPEVYNLLWCQIEDHKKRGRCRNYRGSLASVLRDLEDGS